MALKELKLVQALNERINSHPGYCDKNNVEARNEVNSIIREKWKIEEKIAKDAKSLSKGDSVYYIDNKTNEIKDAQVKYLGVYKNDHNDYSSFVRLANGKYSWYQSYDSISK